MGASLGSYDIGDDYQLELCAVYAWRVSMRLQIPSRAVTLY
jgi:hypothetical protein